MAEAGRRPAVCCMAYVALYSRVEMTVWLGSRVAIRTVTSIALTGSTSIVYPGTTQEGCSGMTEVAIQGGVKVCWVGLGIFTLRCYPIMAGLAIVHDAGMIEHRAGEAKRETSGMTDTAILVCWYMGVCFT